MKLTTLFLFLFALSGIVLAAPGTTLTADLRGESGARGKAAYVQDGDHVRMSLFLENVNARQVKVAVGGTSYRVMIDSTGSGRLFLDSDAGDRIPRLHEGDEMRILAEDGPIARGRFR